MEAEVQAAKQSWWKRNLLISWLCVSGHCLPSVAVVISLSSGRTRVWILPSWPFPPGGMRQSAWLWWSACTTEHQVGPSDISSRGSSHIGDNKQMTTMTGRANLNFVMQGFKENQLNRFLVASQGCTMWWNAAWYSRCTQQNQHAFLLLLPNWSHPRYFSNESQPAWLRLQCKQLFQLIVSAAVPSAASTSVQLFGPLSPCASALR